jgi:hypothetical protein
MKKWQEYSVGRLQQAILSIEQTAPLEEKRSSMRRKKSLEQDYSTLQTHCGRLDFDIPRLGIWYDPKQYLEVAHTVDKALMLFLATEVEK